MDKLKEVRREFRKVFLLLGLFSLFVNLLLLTMPLYMLQIYDRILPSSSLDTLTFLSIIAGAALVVLGLLEAIRAIVAARSAATLETKLGASALRASMMHNQLGSADIQPVRDLASIRSFVSSRAVFALMDLPFAPLFIGILYIIHPTLFWLTLAGAAVLFAIAIVNQWLISKSSQDAMSRQSMALSTAQSISRNSESLRAMGMVSNGVKIWGGHNSEALIATGEVDSRNAILTGLSRTVRMGLQIAILGVGALLVLRNEMTAGMIFAASIISGRGLQPIDQVIGGWKQFVVTRQSWQNLTSALAKSPENIERTILQDPKGDISIEAVLVAAPGGLSRPPILNRTSLSIKAGQIVGMVGPSGSGKSTLARLMVGAQTPDAGIVRIDGTDMKNWDPNQIGRKIGYLGQDVELLPGTIRDNIARLDPNPDSDAVLQAAQKAQVHELIQQLPGGYDTLVGPGGVALSGGQKQRIGLARAFYGNPCIVVLDEPNANLDEDGEVALHKAILAAGQSGVTIVVITQRKQVLGAVDKILRLHKGTVDFFGTKEEFVKALQGLQARKRQNAQKASSTVSRGPSTPPVSTPAPATPVLQGGEKS